jgi:hypothetical protein
MTLMILMMKGVKIFLELDLIESVIYEFLGGTFPNCLDQ